MPKISPASSGWSERAPVTETESSSKSRGRKRYCKKCKFTCVDAREFTAHQSTHLESDDLKQDSATFSLSSNTTPSQRTLRPKRNSKGSISDFPVSTMEMTNESAVEEEMPATVDAKVSRAFTAETEHSQEKLHIHQKTGSATSAAVIEEFMEVDRGGDEPDSMTMHQDDIDVHDDKNKFVNKEDNEMDNLSEDEDEYSDDRLVIDDEGLTKSPAPKLNNSQRTNTYSCQLCEMTTTSVRAYLYHLNEDHNADKNIFECSKCDYTTIHKQKLAQHLRLHLLTAGSERLSTSFSSAENTPTNKLTRHNKFSGTSFAQDSPLFVEEPEDDEENNGTDTPSMDEKSTPVPVVITSENIDHVLDEDKKKKKKTRQEVDPGKYFEAVDSSGTKYACSQCGNIYKWRKSLNKHWKEKHSMDPLAEVASPPGMIELLKSGKYTQLGARRIYDKNFLATIKTNKSDDLSRSTPNSITDSPSPPNFSSSLAASTSRMTSPAVSLIPKMIGPFIASTTQPVFPGMPVALSHLSLHSNGYDSSEESALDLTRDNKPEPRHSPYQVNRQEPGTSHDQEQPLDFSKNKSVDKIKIEKPWEEMSNLKPAHTLNQLIPRLHHCSKCDFTSTSEVDFANHTSSHLNKRIVRCFECKLQINSMDELNNHFIKLHFRKLSDYKEAIKKIPHGLQQTYHLLNMEIQEIGDLGSQDLGTSEGKSLKCKKCDFEAKWPAELQKHAVSHSEERPYICMVCGSTYKWKWDLVKHFQKSHPNLPNPYRRNDKKDTTDGSSEDEDEPMVKRVKLETNSGIMNGGLFNRDDNISVEGIIAATQAGQRLISSQPNILDDEPSKERNLPFFTTYPYTSNAAINQASQIAQSAQVAEEISKAQKAAQDAIRNRQISSGVTNGGNINKKSNGKEPGSSSPSPVGGRSEELPYKCTMCNYHARWPSEVTQHMKNHSDSKPYLCPRCEYRSKWKWDVVKHLKRCGGGGINDVIDTTKARKKEMAISTGPPNAVVSQQGKIKKMTPQPTLAYLLPSMTDDDHQGDMMARSDPNNTSDSSSGDDLSRPASAGSAHDYSSNSANNNDSTASENNVNNNYTAYNNGIPFSSLNPQVLSSASALFPTDSKHSSSSPARSRGPSPVAHASSYRQGGEIWNCPHCPFTTQSQAELKRHSGLHSDDKPFKCDVCQYSTRWACDLKKHRKSYNHFPKVNNIKDRKEKPETPQGRFKCTQCDIFFQSLDSLLDHRLSEHIGQDSSHSGSPAPLTEIEIDVARIKHPRKQVKKIECSKCPFVCKSRQTMDKHKEEHALLEESGIQCFYCSLLFKDKESLLDHITTHSAFNSKEWETFFMISDDDQHQVKDSGRDICKKFEKIQKIGKEKVQNMAQPQKKCTESEKDVIDSTEARIQQILNEIPKQLTNAQQTPNHNKFKCEWCPAEFVNLTAVYKHALQAHPIQLKEQDMSSSKAGKSHSGKSPSGQQAQAKKCYTGEPIDILKQQIAEKRNHQINEKHNEASTSKLLESMSKKADDDRGAKRFDCDKCNFSSANLITFQNHLELHGSKLPSQCWFCDYSVEHMNLLYQHMKISHTRKWKALSQDPKYAAEIHRMNQVFANSSIQGNNNDSPPDISQISDLDAVDLSSKGKLSHSEVIHDIVYITRQQHTWSGIPVNIVPVGGALNFVCPHCSFHDASIAETCCHVMQSHRAMSKFTCKKCQFTDDNIHVMSDHCKREHPVHERIVEVLDFKQINFSELQIVQLNALKEKMANKVSKKADISTDVKTSSTKVMSCPFCPFKTFVTEHMKVHVSDHGRQAQHLCPVCDFSSDFLNIIKEHIRVHDVGYTFDSRSFIDIKTPVKVKKELGDRKMNETELKFSARAHAASETSHSDQEGSPKSRIKRIRYRCSTCPYHTTCRSNMIKHMRQHSNNKKYKCTKCSYSAARAVLLKNHLESHEAPIDDDGQYHDIFCDPNSPNDTFKADDNESEDTENDVEDFNDDDDDANSDDSDDIDAKAIADLEAKDILEAENAHKASFLLEDNESVDKQFRKQKCPHCPFSSNSAYEFRKHLNFHGTQERYKCDHCSYSLDRLNLLSQHRRLHSDEPGYNPNPPAADLLNTSFILQQNTENLSADELIATANFIDGKIDMASGKFSCSYCPFKSSKKEYFDAHCSGHNLQNRYICDYCDWSIDRVALLYQHRRVHETEPDYVSVMEEKMFLNKEFDDGAAGEFEAKFTEIKNADKPMDENEMKTPLSPPFKLTVVKKSYPCSLCPFKTSSKNNYFIHKSMHESSAEFSCSECSYASRSRGLLQQHLRLHINNDTNICSPTTAAVRSPFSRQQSSDMIAPQQDASISIKRDVPQPANENLQSHPELKCQRCPYTAFSQAALKEHIRCHMAQDSLTCPFCDFSATSRLVLFPHIQVHFPGTKLDAEALEQMLLKNINEKNINNNNCSDDISKSISPSSEVSLAQPEKEPVKTTRVYVCQFCEREFEAKHLMIQHERQHLVGSCSDSKCD